MQQPKHRILISGGGTGGHIFPAIAIANALKARLDNPDILFVGARGKMEMEKVPKAGYPIEGLWISGLQRNLTLKNMLFPLKLICSLTKANHIVNKFKPDIAIGVGGYASGPTIKVAARKGIPTIIQEQNSYPGITNRLLSKHVNKICVAYDGMDRFFPGSKIVITGNPVRQDILNLNDKKSGAYDFFKLQKTKKTLIIIGGSQGAMSINKNIQACLESLIENNIQIIWQTGKLCYEAACEAANQLKQKITPDEVDNNVKIHDFISRMDYAYAIADLVVSRAGAIAISELCVAGKPVILIPLPSAAEDHQTKNAMSLVKKEAARMIKDSEQNEKLHASIISLINENNELKKLENNISKLGIRDAAIKITDEIISLMET
ncbi:MAG: undecaprenyldiphospho-muramoylpentapeptide beta-N-acetylglucosaminyltransferase [Bacteroidetes bacterium]|nr:undecaprenyldiphospho-muramoylpentapeptide beta-N-acetylglucosaminyltransferase [Bacteroidota bacterium]